MAYALQVFVSSTCYDLRDLRSAIKTWLLGLGLVPMMSDEGGFPNIDGMPPYATCLRVVEECPLVIGIIDRRYGRRFQDWGPYKEHAGRGPTHAELIHALDSGKRVLIYVQDDVWTFYEVWRKNREVFKAGGPEGLDESTLLMFEELKLRKPAPWIEHFADVAEVIKSLQSEFVNQLYNYLKDRERQSTDQAGYLLAKITEAAPEVRTRIEAELNPSIVADRDKLKQQLSDIERELDQTKGESSGRIGMLEQEKTQVESRLADVTKQLGQASLMVLSAAMKDGRWFEFLRTTMRPRQPGRVPFHNSLEVALRGFSLGGDTQKAPVLREVTWSKLAYKENDLHRGYKAGLIFKGADFVPGITWTVRRCGETKPPNPNTDYFWRLPSIYFGDYLEVSVSEDEIQSPLSSRDHEFQVRNPEGKTSAWIPFTYAFDDVQLIRVRDAALEEGLALLEAGRAVESVEPLRKASVMSDRLRSVAPPPRVDPGGPWNRALDEAALAKLRFRVGDQLVVHSGPHAGKNGAVEKLLLRQHHAYLIQSEGEPSFQASDEQVDRLTA